MSEIDEMYNDLIMEHSMNSYNKKKLDHCDLCSKGHNPNCGDEIELELILDGNVIKDMAFTGHGCAISQASTSIMIDTLRDKTIEQAKEIIEDFIRMIKRENLSKEETPLIAYVHCTPVSCPNLLPNCSKLLVSFCFFKGRTADHLFHARLFVQFVRFTEE